jgi:hypothetical protein
MKKRILLFTLAYLFVYKNHIDAQESRFYVKLKSAAMQFAPDLIEESVQQQQEGNCRTEKFILYRKRAEILDSAIWKVCVTGIEVEVHKNDAPYHQFRLEEGEQEGRIGQVKGKLVVKAIRDTLTNKIRVWELSDKFDQRYRLVYNPEIKRIESQFEPFAQRHALQNFMFQDIPSQFMPLTNPAATVAELTSGDALQVVYYAESDSGSHPRQLNDYLVLERDTKSEFPVTRVAFKSTDLFSGVTMNNDTVEIQELPDGLFIGNNLALPYSVYKSGFSRIDPADEDWRCYILPREDFANPLLELVYQKSDSILGVSMDLLNYWNSELPYRISWIRNFPLPFQEYQTMKPKVEYIKQNGREQGEKFDIKVSLYTGIRYFDETPDGIRLTVFTAAPGKFSLALLDAENKVVKTQPENFNLKAGMQRIEIKCPDKLSDRYYKLVLQQVVDSETRVLQEYVFLSRYF